MTISRILYATDFSPASLTAWPAALELTHVFGAELIALHVVPPLMAPPATFVSAEIFGRHWERARDEAASELSKLVAQAEAEGFKARSRVVKGRAANEIPSVAAEERADLIVVGAAGRSGFQQAFIGSVANEVVRLAPCPVLTVGPAGTLMTRLATVLYPTDFSPVAHDAWPVAETLALASGASVILLHVMPEVPEDARISAMERAKLEVGYRRNAEQSVTDLLAQSRLPKDRVETILTHGVPEEQIVNHALAKETSVVVMGTHGWSGLLRWTLGSAAHRVIRTAPCPVLTVPVRFSRSAPKAGRRNILVLPEASITQDALSVEIIRRQLSAEMVGCQIYLFGEVPSTNETLRHLAKAGAREGAVVLAESQSSGHGRLGKSWFSPPGVNLYASVLFRPAIGSKDAPVFTFIASLALTDAIRALGLMAAIKWPNDILVDRKKVAGVLAELATTGDRLDYVILGVGVNLNVKRKALHDALGAAGQAATSLAEAAGGDIDRNAFAASFLNALDEWLVVYRNQGSAALLGAWRDRDILTGRRVEVREGRITFDGRVLGVHAEGRLVVEDSKGRSRKILTGEVRPLD